MKQRKKMKAWVKVLIIVPTALVACFVLWVALHMVANKYSLCHSCFHKVGTTSGEDSVVSVELVSQEKPLAYFELMEQPEIEGVKVKLTYEDGRSRVVNAFAHRDHDGGGLFWHRVGMFFDIDPFDPEQPPLKPGLNSIAMYCIDRLDHGEEVWSFTRRWPDWMDDDTASANCIVDVYVQTLEEYVAAQSRSIVTLTESGKVTLPLKKGASGPVSVVVRESGTYGLEADDGEKIIRVKTAGGGEIISGDIINGTPFTALLNANEPMLLRAYTYSREKTLHLSLKRLPD